MISSTFQQVTIVLPHGRIPGRLRLTSEQGFNGCEGFVRPGILEIDGTERLIQAKSFYEQSVDDRGDQFSQDPDEKVRESYEAFVRLEKLGFKVVPLFGMTHMDNRPLLLMDDLRRGETIEIYDEKHVHRGREVVNVIDGREIRSNARKTIDGLDNINTVRLDMLRTNLLEQAYHISLGYPGGTAHMITRDPKTNRGDVFVTDVGGFWQSSSVYSEAIDLEEAVAVPETQIISAYAALLKRHHPSLNADELLHAFNVNDATRKEFMALQFKATVGLSLQRNAGGWYKEAEWARKVFPKNSFSDPMMQAKLACISIAKSFESYTGKTLFRTDHDACDRFIKGDDVNSLLIGMDFAYLAALDKRMMYVDAARKAVDDNHQPLSIPNGPLELHEDGFPIMSFFERWDEPLVDRHVVSVYGEKCHNLRGNAGDFSDPDYVLEVELDWQTAMRVESSLHKPVIKPEAIQGLLIGKERVQNFDPNKLVVGRPGGGVYATQLHYVYDGAFIYRTTIEDNDLGIPPGGCLRL